MTLWLLRHGHAQAHAAQDQLRELTDYGRQQVRQSAEHLRGVALDLMLVSPYVRAQQTADLVVQQLTYSGPRQCVEWLTPDGSVRRVLAELDQYEGLNLLLVTHQPLVGELGGVLLHGLRGNPLSMDTASLAQLDGAAMAAGLMALRALRHAQ